MSRWKPGRPTRCHSYCGVACVDGSCPIANREEYEERCIPTIEKCDDCHLYKGCEDCCFENEPQYCPKKSPDTKEERA